MKNWWKYKINSGDAGFCKVVHWGFACVLSVLLNAKCKYYIAMVIDDWREWNYNGMMLTREAPPTQRKSCPNTTLSTINFTRTNSGLRVEQPAALFWERSCFRSVVLISEVRGFHGVGCENCCYPLSWWRQKCVLKRRHSGTTLHNVTTEDAEVFNVNTKSLTFVYFRRRYEIFHVHKHEEQSFCSIFTYFFTN